MSLISDAIKTAQRQKAGMTPAKESQPLIDGFFPYVSTSAPKRRSNLMPIVLGLGATIVIAVIAWIGVTKLRSSSNKPDRAPIVLPPRGAAQAPVTKDSSKATASRDSQAAPAPVQAPAAVASAESSPPSAAPRHSRQASSSIVVDAAPVASRDSVTANPRQDIEPAPTSISRVVPADARPNYEEQAAALFNLKDYAGAREKFLLATRYAPTARAWTNYGVTLQMLGDNAGASTAYQTATTIDANYLEAWLYQGRLAVAQGDPARAVPLFQRARSINPRNAEVNTDLAELEFNAKNWTDARKFADDAVKADNANFRAHYYLAVSADQLGDSEVALREYTAYLQTIGGSEAQYARVVQWARQRVSQLRGKP
jgi:Flp pilus assembly protein TadD